MPGGRRTGTIVEGMDHCIERRVTGIDTLDRGFQHFGWRYLLAADQCSQTKGVMPFVFRKCRHPASYKSAVRVRLVTASRRYSTNSQMK